MKKESSGRLMPVDQITIAYFALTSLLILLFRQNLSRWYLYLLTHLIVIIAVFLLRWLSTSTSYSNSNSSASFTFFSDLRFWKESYPLFMILPLYQEMNKLHRLLSPRYLDHIIIPWEGKLFFGQPSIYLAEQLPSAWLSEFLHACYLSYYFLIPALGFPLYFKNIYELRIFVFGVFLTTVSCCLLYILFPVLGPYYQFAPIKTSLSQKPFYKLTHWLLESGASKGTAFPSLHVSIAVVVFCSSLKYLPETFPVFCPVILSIIFATVYCRFHYALDAFGGAFIGLLSYLISYLIFTKIKGGSKKCLSEVIYRSDS